MRIAAAALLAATVLGPTAAHAVDGVIEINQAKVMAAGGFPFNITAGGSYRLTSNLDVAAGGQGSPENLFGIDISVASEPKEVDLDLNGFSLIGPVTCTWNSEKSVLSCSSNQNGSGKGVRSSVPLSIHDGTVQGFATHGISMDYGALARNLVLRWNNWGIIAYEAVLESVHTTENRDSGVSVTGGVLNRIISQRNGHWGIEMASGVLDGCESKYNAWGGVKALQGSQVTNCETESNGGYGIYADNAGECSYRGNTIRNNAGGTTTNCLETGPNVCDGDLTCP